MCHLYSSFGLWENEQEYCITKGTGTEKEVRKLILVWNTVDPIAAFPNWLEPSKHGRFRFQASDSRIWRKMQQGRFEFVAKGKMVLLFSYVSKIGYAIIGFEKLAFNKEGIV